MSKLTKLAFLYLVLVLSVAGTGKDPYADLLHLQPTIQEFKEAGASSYLSESKPNVYGIHSTFERVVSQANSFPAPPAKNHPGSFWARSFAMEAGLQSFALQYLSQARTIHLTLSIGDIIFPFHYFW